MARPGRVARGQGTQEGVVSHLLVNVCQESLQGCETTPKGETSHLELQLGDSNGASLGLKLNVSA